MTLVRQQWRPARIEFLNRDVVREAINADSSDALLRWPACQSASGACTCTYRLRAAVNPPLNINRDPLCMLGIDTARRVAWNPQLIRMPFAVLWVLVAAVSPASECLMHGHGKRCRKLWLTAAVNLCVSTVRAPQSYPDLGGPRSACAWVQFGVDPAGHWGQGASFRSCFGHNLIIASTLVQREPGHAKGIPIDVQQIMQYVG